ncbi:MAG: helix-turn-helix domain-containing protein [Oscillospiraceae bacterium]|nr:helix-turn-helix domain-containing protein [Oscillospiraceae bacterium]
MSKFHLRLRELRNSRDLTQQNLADCLNISKSSVNMYERGEREPGIALLESIADFFNVDLDYLTGKSDNPQKYLLQEETTNNLEHLLTKDEYNIIHAFRSFNDEGKEKILDTISDMIQLDRYKKGHEYKAVEKPTPIYRAARSQDNTEQHEIIQDGKDLIDKLSKIPPVTKKEDF